MEVKDNSALFEKVENSAEGHPRTENEVEIPVEEAQRVERELLIGIYRSQHAPHGYDITISPYMNPSEALGALASLSNEIQSARTASKVLSALAQMKGVKLK